LATDDQAVVDTPGWQLWQGLFGFALPDAWKAPPMKQPAVQLPPEQTCPLPHGAPAATGVYAVVDVVGVQAWQGSLGSTAPGATTLPPMKHEGTQASAAQIFPGEHAAPSGSTLYEETSTEGWQLLQGSAGSATPFGTRTPPMKHAPRQLPEAQTIPAPQFVPSATGTSLEVDAVGLQTAHGFAASMVPGACVVPPT